MIPIKRIDDGVISPFYQTKLSDYSLSEELSGDRMVSGDIVTPQIITSEEWVQDSFIDYRGEWWRIYDAPQRSKDNTKREYTYSVVFRPIQEILKDIKFLDVVDSSARSSGINNVQFVGNIEELASRISANLNTKRALGWTISVGSGVPTDKYVEVSIDDGSIWDALQIIKDEFGLKFTILGNVIVIWDLSGSISYTNPVTLINTTRQLGSNITHQFAYGKNDGLYELIKTPTSDRPVAYIRAVGSEKNLPYNYYKTSERFSSPYLGYAPNLLPPIFTEGDLSNAPFTKDYYEDAEQVAAGNKKEVFLRFDGSDSREEIYPTIEGVSHLGLRIDEILSVGSLGSDEFDDNGKAVDSTFNITLNPLGFNISDSISAGGEMTVNMKTGNCAGANFKVISINNRNLSGVGLQKTFLLGDKDIAQIDEVEDGDSFYTVITTFSQEVARNTKYHIEHIPWSAYTSLTNNSDPYEPYYITIEPQLYNKATEELIALSGGGTYAITNATDENMLMGTTFIAEQDIVSSGQAFLNEGLWELRAKISLSTEESKYVTGKIYLRASFNIEEPFMKDEYSIYQPGIEGDVVTLTLQKSIDDFNDILPNATLTLQSGDKFALINIDLPDSYVIAAEQRLEDEVLKYKSEYNFHKYLYTGKIFPPLLIDDKTIEPKLYVGSKIRLKEYSEALEIISISMDKSASEMFGIYSFQLKATSKKELSKVASLEKRIARFMSRYDANTSSLSAFNRSISNKTDEIEVMVMANQAAENSPNVNLNDYVKKTGGEFTGTILINKLIPSTLIIPETEPVIEEGETAVSLSDSGISGEAPIGVSIELNELEDVNVSTPSNDQVLTYYGGLWINKSINSITSWDSIPDKPSTFPPSPHTHEYHPKGGSSLLDFVAKKLISSTLVLPSSVPDLAAGQYAITAYSSGIGGSIPSEAIPESISELNDVLILSPANNQVLTYEGGVWKNKEIAKSWDSITDKPSTFPPSAHTHGELYYTKLEVNTILEGYLTELPPHNHDDRHLLLPKSLFNSSLGVLIRTDIASYEDVAVEVVVRGSKWASDNLLNTDINFYHTPTNISGLRAIGHGSLGYVYVFDFDGVAHVWFPSPPTYSNIRVQVFTSGSNRQDRVLYITNEPIPSTGRTKTQSILPSIIFTELNSNRSDVAWNASSFIEGGTALLNKYLGINSNATSATKLVNARTIWGQSFDGSDNVSGALTSVTDLTMTGSISGPVNITASGTVTMNENINTNLRIPTSAPTNPESGKWYLYIV